jgi:hypothetical protein
MFNEGFQLSGYDAACSDIASAPCTTFIEKAIGDYSTDQMTRKDNAIANVMYTANRVFDADKNSSYAIIRSSDIKKFQDEMDVNGTQFDKLKHDVDLTRRQFEINEYHYHNKLDTLFFLQVFFIAVLIMAILIYFNRRGMLTTQMTGLLTAILSVIVIIIAVSRYFYTIRTRDRRLWHRRYFQTERAPSDPLISVCGPSAQNITVNLNSKFTQDEIQCGIDTNEKYDTWLESVNAEAKAQMKGTNASSLFSSYQLAPSCKRR